MCVLRCVQLVKGCRRCACLLSNTSGTHLLGEIDVRNGQSLECQQQNHLNTNVSAGSSKVVVVVVRRNKEEGGGRRKEKLRWDEYVKRQQARYVSALSSHRMHTTNPSPPPPVHTHLSCRHMGAATRGRSLLSPAGAGAPVGFSNPRSPWSMPPPAPAPAPAAAAALPSLSARRRFICTRCTNVIVAPHSAACSVCWQWKQRKRWVGCA